MPEGKPARLRISGKADLPSQLNMMIRALLASRLRNRLFGIGGAVFLVVAATTYAQIRLNRWNQPFYDALARRDMHGFLTQLTVFAVIAGSLLVLNVLQRFLSETMKLWLRQGLTQDLIQEWLKPDRAHRLSGAGAIGINPDQRMHEDARHLTELSGDLGVELMQATVLVATFITVLWRVSGSFHFKLLGHVYVISGYMVWAAIIYALAASLVSYWVGRSLVPRNAQRYQRESELRAALMRTNDYFIASRVYGKALEVAGRKVLDRLNRVLGAMWRLVFGLTNLTWITAGYGWLMLVTPILVAAPAYFSGTLTFGGMMMAVGAFNQVQLSLRWYVDNFSSIADWRATLLRVAEFRRALIECDALGPVKSPEKADA
ncbi:MAG TPA: SbmA/BacA-like family transporter [Rhizomicrobium sp.]|nr:SbmA/BacA-like family transporter [Rhizomicrobium sp.]